MGAVNNPQTIRNNRQDLQLASLIRLQFPASFREQAGQGTSVTSIRALGSQRSSAVLWDAAGCSDAFLQSASKLRPKIHAGSYWDG